MFNTGTLLVGLVIMTNIFNFSGYQDWIKSRCHYDNTDIAPNSDTNINHIGLNGERLNHPRIFRNIGARAKILKDVSQGGFATPYVDYTGGNLIYCLDTDRFITGDEILIEDDNNSCETRIISGIDSASHTIQFATALENNYLMVDFYRISTVREITISIPDTGTFVTGDYVRLGNDDKYLLRKILEVDTSDETRGTLVIKCAGIIRNFGGGDNGDMVDLLFPYNKLAPVEDDVLVLPEKTYPFNPQQYGIKAGTLHNSFSLKDKNQDSLGKINSYKYNIMTVETDNAIEYGAISILFTPDDSDYSRFSQLLDFDNPMIMPGVQDTDLKYKEMFNSYDTDSDMQKIWRGATTTLDNDTLKWVYTDTNHHLDAIFPLPVDFVARSHGENIFRFKLKGNSGNTGTMKVRIYAVDGTYIECDGADSNGKIFDLTNTGFDDFEINLLSDDINGIPFAGKKYVRRIRFETSHLGSGTLWFDDVSPFKVPNYDDIMGNPTSIVGGDVNGTGAIIIYYDVREAPIFPLLSDVNSAYQISVQIEISDTSGFVEGDKIVIYDSQNFEFAEVSNIDIDGTHLTITPLYGIFFNGYGLNSYGSIQFLTNKVRKIAGAYSANGDLQNFVKTGVLISPDAGEWDHDSVSDPSVSYKYNSENQKFYDLYLAYSGKSGATKKIGFAYSRDFLTFEKLPQNPFSDLNGYDNPKIIELNELEGLIARNSDNDIELLKQKNNFYNNLDFSVILLVRPDSSLGYPDPGGAVIYDQGNFRIRIKENYTIELYCRFPGDNEVTTSGEGEITGKNCWGTQLVKDHWNLIVAQTAGDNIGIYRIGIMVDFPDPWTEYFQHSPWLLNADVHGGVSDIVIVPTGATSAIPVANQAIYMFGRGYESTNGYNERFHNQLNRVESITNNHNGTFTLHLLNPVGGWGFAKNYDGNTYGVQLAQGIDKVDPLNFGKTAFAKPLFSYNGEFPVSIVSERGFEQNAVSNAQQSLDQNYFSPPKIGCAIDGTKPFTTGIVAFVSCQNALIEDEEHTIFGFDNRFQLFWTMIGAYNPSVGTVSFPVWYKYDLLDDSDGATGILPTLKNPVAYWNMADYETVGTRDLVPDDTGNRWDMYSQGAVSITIDSPGYGQAISFPKTIEGLSTYLMVYKYSNFVKLFNVLDHTIAPSIVEKPISVIPQLYDDGVALISTIEGKKDYPIIGHTTIDFFECKELPDTFYMIGNLYNPSGCSVKIYFSVVKNITKDSDWHLIDTYNAEGHVSINEYVDNLSNYQADDVIFYLRLKIEFLSDGSDTSELIDLALSIDDYTEIPTLEFKNQWISTNNSPSLKITLIDDVGTKYNVLDVDSILSNTSPSITYEIPIYVDQESNIISSNISLTFINKNGFWNPDNDGTGGGIASPLNGKNYLDFKIQVFAGFGDEFISQGIYKIEKIKQKMNNTVEVSCSSEMREILDQPIGFETPDSKDFIGTLNARDFIKIILHDIGGIDTENIYFSDSLNDFLVSNITIDNQSIISVFRKICQAANYIAYINNQGEIRIVNRADMTTEGDPYSDDSFLPNIVKITDIILNNDASLDSASRQNVIKKVKITGAQNVYATGTSADPKLDYGRYDTFGNDFIQNSDDAQAIADQLISDYGLNRKILETPIKSSPHLKLLDRLIVDNPISGTTQTYLIMKINRVLLKSDTITAILLPEPEV